MKHSDNDKMIRRSPADKQLIPGRDRRRYSSKSATENTENTEIQKTKNLKSKV